MRRAPKFALSAFVAMSVAFGIAPATALAGSTTSCTSETCDHQAIVGNIHYDTLAEAVEGVPNNGKNVTITLNEDVSLSAQLELESGQNVTIDGGEDGATIYVPVTSSGGSALHVPNGAEGVTLTVKNVSFVP